MKALLERLSGPLHLTLALLALWLLASSPWLGMYRRLPSHAGFVNLAHVALGLAALLLVLIYLVGCSQGGRWQLYFPWLAGRLGAVGRDLGGLAHGRLPAVEGGGLFALIEGLLLLALLAKSQADVRASRRCTGPDRRSSSAFMNLNRCHPRPAPQPCLHSVRPRPSS